jgi:hypothetical protein
MHRWISQGRGQGRAADYQPWLHLRDVWSIGHAHKVPGIKISRTHHVLSDLEAACLLVLEFQQDVLDIREQFPLLPTDLTQHAAHTLRLRHPVYPGTSVASVMTSDFCADVRSSGSGTFEVAIAVKYTSDLKHPRTRELLAIERQANRLAGRRWHVFTELSVADIVLKNLSWLRKRALPRSAVDHTSTLDYCRTLRALNRPHLSLDGLLSRVASRLGMATDQALEFLSIAGWHQHLFLQLDHPICRSEPLLLSEHQPALLNFYGGDEWKA